MSIGQFIDNELKGNELVMFMKGTPQFPMCGFSGQVVQILDNLGVAYKGLNVLDNDELRHCSRTKESPRRRMRPASLVSSWVALHR